MKRIVFFNHTGIVSGAEKMLLLLLANLPPGMCDVSLLCPAEGVLQESARKMGIRTYTSPAICARFSYNPALVIRYLLSIAAALHQVRKSILSQSPDFVQANTVRAGIVATLATIGSPVRVIWHAHDILPPHPITTIVRLLAHLSSRVRIVACSNAAAQTLRPFRFTGNEVTVIHNGIDLSRFREDSSVRAAMRAQLGFASSHFVIGVAGQIARRKGQLGLIRAFADVHRACPESILLIIGAPLFNKDHEYLAMLENEVRNLGIARNVLFLGQRLDVPALMQALDLVVLNSDVEPFALVLIEAMISGKAVIATDCGGPAEIIQHGTNGEIVPVGDGAALVGAMVRYARNPLLRKRYGEAAIRHVEQRFSKEHYIEAWCAYYQRLTTDTHTEYFTPRMSTGQLEIQSGARE